jgi:hypothetical protein
LTEQQDVDEIFIAHGCLSPHELRDRLRDRTYANEEMVLKYQRAMDGDEPGPIVTGISADFAAWLFARGIGASLRKYAARTPAPASPIFRARPPPPASPPGQSRPDAATTHCERRQAAKEVR